MPDWIDLSRRRSAASSTGSRQWADQQEARRPAAELATAAEIETGAATGSRATGRAVCRHRLRKRHSIRSAAAAVGAARPDLTAATPTTRDAALTLFLKHPCSSEFGVDHGVPHARGVVAIKAYLRQIALLDRSTTGSGPERRHGRQTVDGPGQDSNGHGTAPAKPLPAGPRRCQRSPMRPTARQRKPPPG